MSTAKSSSRKSSTIEVVQMRTKYNHAKWFGCYVRDKAVIVKSKEEMQLTNMKDKIENKKLKNKLKGKYSHNSMEPFCIPENMDSTVRELFIGMNNRISRMEEDLKLLKEMYCLPLRQLIENTRNKLWDEHADEFYKNKPKGEWDIFYKALQSKGYGSKYMFLVDLSSQFTEQSNKIHNYTVEYNKRLIAKAIDELSDSPQKNKFNEMFLYCFESDIDCFLE